jgi:hypothetical protein
MSENKLRWENEMMGGKPRNPKACMTCLFSHGQPPFADTPRKGCCQIYEYPDAKPDEVYFDGADCEYYEKAL